MVRVFDDGKLVAENHTRTVDDGSLHIAQLSRPYRGRGVPAIWLADCPGVIADNQLNITYSRLVLSAALDCAKNFVRQSRI